MGHVRLRLLDRDFADLVATRGFEQIHAGVLSQLAGLGSRRLYLRSARRSLRRWMRPAQWRVHWLSWLREPGAKAPTDSLRTGAHELDVAYDGAYGFPRLIDIDYDVHAADNELNVRSHDLRPF